MIDLGKVVQGVVDVTTVVPDLTNETDANWIIRRLDKAVAALKAQEPRVMTLKEIVSAECVWIEYATSGNIIIALPWDIELTDDTYNFIGMPNCFVEFRSLYDEEWRCWTSRPTDEQRAATPWAEPPKEET